MSPLLSCRLDRIEQFGNRVRSALASADKDPKAHLYDPVNAFQLVNRYINGWATIHDDIYDDNGQGEEYCPRFHDVYITQHVPSCVCAF